MTSPHAEPSPQALNETLASLAVQVTALRGQVTLINKRLSTAGLTGDLNLAAGYRQLSQTVAQLSQTVADALDADPPRGPAAPDWTGLDRDTCTARLTDLRHWADTVLRQHYDGYQLRDCWASHHQAIWELSTLAAEWRRTYSGKHPSLDRALEFYDRWLPGTMRRITDITSKCSIQCVMDSAARPPGTYPAYP